MSYKKKILNIVNNKKENNQDIHDANKPSRMDGSNLTLPC